MGHRIAPLTISPGLLRFECVDPSPNFQPPILPGPTFFEGTKRGVGGLTTLVAPVTETFAAMASEEVSCALFGHVQELHADCLLMFNSMLSRSSRCVRVLS